MDAGEAAKRLGSNIEAVRQRAIRCAGPELWAMTSAPGSRSPKG